MRCLFDDLYEQCSDHSAATICNSVEVGTLPIFDFSSSNQIAGVCNEDGNIVGMMPHPERAVESEINPEDNKPSSLIFESLLKKMGVNN